MHVYLQLIANTLLPKLLSTFSHKAIFSCHYPHAGRLLLCSTALYSLQGDAQQHQELLQPQINPLNPAALMPPTCAPTIHRRSSPATHADSSSHKLLAYTFSCRQTRTGQLPLRCHCTNFDSFNPGAHGATANHWAASQCCCILHRNPYKPMVHFI